VEVNIHPPPHGFVGGLQADTWASPGDPIFFLHHAQLDRVWSIWQNLDPNRRTYALDGTKTIMNRKAPLEKLDAELALTSP
jgi:tyrosinase